MANKKCMVFETLGPTTGLQIQESQNTNEVRMTGVFGVCGIKNENRRIYSKENYNLMVENLQKVIATEGLLGELEHPNTMNINLNNVSHKIESIEMNEDGTVTGTILLLDTAKGKDAQAIVKGGVPLYISSRGAGSIDESGHVTLSTIKTYDLVGTPGFAQAKLNLKPNQTLECLNEGLNDESEVWAIIDEGEDDDLLGDGGDDKDKKEEDNKGDDGSSKSDDSSKEGEDKKEGEESEDDKDKKEDETSEKDDNNKNSQNTTMDDLKNAIDQLTEKVTSLEAELHVAQESLTAKEEEIKTLTEKLDSLEIPAAVDYEKIEKWVTEEFAPEFEGKLSDSIQTSVQSWVAEEFTDTIQKWIVEEFAPEVQNWVCEEFAPEVQNWVCEEFAPEVQNWICEEFAPEVQNWVCEEFAPEVQNWVCEEFAPVVEGWVNDEFAPENNQTLTESIEAKVNENVSEFMESQKTSKLSDIDALLESLENKDAALTELVKEQKAADKFAGVYVVEHMPAQYQPSWNALNEEKQAEIVRMSKAYDVTKEEVLNKFWESVDFSSATPAKQEVKNEDITSNYYNNVFAQMTRLRNA